MPENKENKWLSRIGNVLLVFSFTSVMWGGIGYLMEPRAEDFIMYVVNKYKGESTKVILGKEMKVDKTKALPELGKMYRENKHRHDAEDSILNKWIPYLQKETEWKQVGFFVNVDDPDVVKFHHWDGRDYDAWSDDQGWFYVKSGYKYYP